MLITSVLDTNDASPCEIGETLRRKFWDPKKGYGCYSNFDWAPEVHPLPDFVEVQEWSNETNTIVWKVANWKGVACRYYWDGDGYLEFELPDGRVFVNGDCKKDYTWEEGPSNFPTAD